MRIPPTQNADHGFFGAIRAAGDLNPHAAWAAAATAIAETTGESLCDGGCADAAAAFLDSDRGRKFAKTFATEFRKNPDLRAAADAATALWELAFYCLGIPDFTREPSA